MPTYDYLCPNCGVFDHFQSMTEPALQTCPTCSQPVQRLISGGTGIIFKGSGFFNTDRRAEQRSKKNGTTAAEGSEAKSSSSEKKSDSLATAGV